MYLVQYHVIKLHKYIKNKINLILNEYQNWSKKKLSSIFIIFIFPLFGDLALHMSMYTIYFYH